MVIKKRKRKTSTRTGRVVKIHTEKLKFPDKKEIIERIQKHKLRFDLDYEKGLYDMTPQEADVYDDAINDILTIINKLQYT